MLLIPKSNTGPLELRTVVDLHKLNENTQNLSSHQATEAWCIEKVSTFVFKVVYIEDNENVVADTLSKLYSNDSAESLLARSEFTYHVVLDSDTSVVGNDVFPVLVEIDARIATKRSSCVRRPMERVV